MCETGVRTLSRAAAQSKPRRYSAGPGRHSAVKCAANRKGPAFVPATYAISGLAFAIWVAVCAAAPELIWQGLLLITHHFTLLNLYAIVLIGLILAFFV